MSVWLLKGNDETVMRRAVADKVSALVGDGDASLMVEELTEEQYRTESDSFEIARLVDNAQTPPFLTERRVVVGRHMARFSTSASVEALVSYLSAPLESTDLVLVWERGVSPKQDRISGVPKPLNEALASCGGEVIDTSIPRGKKADDWLQKQIRNSAVEIDPSGVSAIASHLGEDRSQVLSLLSTLESVYGTDSIVGAEQVTPFLGQSGDVAPWDLTDAIDAGRIDAALDNLGRMIQAGGRHPLQIMATLQTHYLRILHLDGAPIAGEKQAAALLGIKGSTYPAKKANAQAKRLGSTKIRRAVELLARADRSLRGELGWPPELVMEVLVARLAALR